MIDIPKNIIQLCAEAGYAAEEEFLGGHKKWNEHSKESKMWYMVCVKAAIQEYINLTSKSV